MTLNEKEKKELLCYFRFQTYNDCKFTSTKQQPSKNVNLQKLKFGLLSGIHVYYQNVKKRKHCLQLLKTQACLYPTNSINMSEFAIIPHFGWHETLLEILFH